MEPADKSFALIAGVCTDGPISLVFLEFNILFTTMAAGEIISSNHTGQLEIDISVISVIMVCWFTGNLFTNMTVIDPHDTASVHADWIGKEKQYVLQGSDIEKISKKCNNGENGSSSDNISEIKSDDCFCRTSEIKGSHRILLPLYNYKGYHVIDEYGKEYAIINGEQNRVAFELSAGFEGQITVEFRDPVYWTAALIIFLGSFVILIAGFLALGRRKQISGIWSS